MSTGIIVIVVLLVMSFVVKSGKAKREQVRQDPNVTPEHFVIRQYAGVLGVMFCVLALVCFAGMMVCIGAKAGWGPTLILAGFTLLCALPLLSMYVWQIEVDGDRLRIRNMFGRVRYLDIREIRRVTAKPRNMGIAEYAYKFFGADGTKLFSLDENTDDIYLLQRLEEIGVMAEYPDGFSRIKSDSGRAGAPGDQGFSAASGSPASRPMSMQEQLQQYTADVGGEAGHAVIRQSKANIVAAVIDIVVGVFVFAMFTVAGMNEGSLLMMKCAVSLAIIAFGVVYLLWAYKYKATVSEAGIVIEDLFRGRRMFTWPEISYGVKTVTFGSTLLQVFANGKNILSVVPTNAGYRSLEQALAARGLLKG